MANKPRRQFKLLLPPADKIALAYGVDQERALRIQANFGIVFELFGDLLEAQVELVEGQAKTAKLIDRQTSHERDVRQVREDVIRFLSGDPIPVEHVLELVFTPFWRGEFVKLKHEVKVKFFAALTEAIDSLESDDKEQEHE